MRFKISCGFICICILRSLTKSGMAAALFEPPFSANHTLFTPSHLAFKPSNSKPANYFTPLLRSPTSACLCAADEAPPEPPDASQDHGVSVERSRDRRKVVRVAWEKLVRWSRSLRSKAKTDVLERTNKVSINSLCGCQKLNSVKNFMFLLRFLATLLFEPVSNFKYCKLFIHHVVFI